MVSKLLIAAATGALAIGGAAAAQPVSTPQALIAKYKAWRGGESFAALRAFHATGRARIGGLEGSLDHWSSARGTSKGVIDFGVFQVAEAVNARQSWAQSPSGQISTLSPFTATEEERADSLLFDGGFHRADASVADAGDAELDGRRWSVVRVTFRDGERYDLLIDAVTGALGGERYGPENRQTIRTFGDWRVVNGVRMPFVEKVSGGAGAPPTQVRFDSVQLADSLPAKLLDRPKSARRVVFDGNGRSSGRVAFDLWGGDRIFVPVTVNGHPVVAMVDSAAASSVIDASLARELGLTPKGAFSVAGAAGAGHASIVAGAAVKIGAARLDRLPLTAMDLAPLSKPLGRPLAFILGKDVFDQLVVDIDFSARAMELSDPDGYSAPRSAHALMAVPTGGGLRAVKASLNGRSTMFLHVDLGSALPLLLYPSGRPAVAQAHLRSKTMVGGVGGAVVADSLSVASLSIGGWRFTDVPAVAMPDNASVLNPAHVEGNVGLPVLARFRTIFDFSHDRIWLLPGRGSNVAFARDMAGLSLSREGDRLRVQMVAPGSPAEEAGFRQGDLLRAIDGHAVGEDYVASGLSRWRFGQAKVKITMDDGTIRTLKMRRYF